MQNRQILKKIKQFCLFCKDYFESIISGKGKKEDWPDEESDKELKVVESEEEEVPIPVVKSKGKIFTLLFAVCSYFFKSVRCDRHEMFQLLCYSNIHGFVL